MFKLPFRGVGGQAIKGMKQFIFIDFHLYIELVDIIYGEKFIKT